jgi:hypothetical protein
LDLGTPVTMDDVQTELEQICRQYRIRSWRVKAVIRNYAFELKDVPEKGEHLKMVYSYDRK